MTDFVLAELDGILAECPFLKYTTDFLELVKYISLLTRKPEYGRKNKVYISSLIICFHLGGGLGTMYGSFIKSQATTYCIAHFLNIRAHLYLSGRHWHFCRVILEKNRIEKTLQMLKTPSQNCLVGAIAATVAAQACVMYVNAGFELTEVEGLNPNT